MFRIDGLRLQDIGELLLMVLVVYFGVWVLLHRKNIPRIPPLSVSIISTIDFGVAALLIIIGFWNTSPTLLRVAIIYIYAVLFTMFLGLLWITIQYHRGKTIH